MVKIIGKHSLITKFLQKKYKDYKVFSTSDFRQKDLGSFFDEGDIIVYVSGLLQSKRIEDQTFEEWTNSFYVNSILPIKIIKYLDKHINSFVFCYIGSESAYKGSFDDTYYLGKLMTQTFIKDFKLKSSDSRMFAIAPSTINSGMTLRRKDQFRVDEYRRKIRNGRFIDVEEIGKIIIELNSKKFKYLSNEVINIDFGKKAKYE